MTMGGKVFLPDHRNRSTFQNVFEKKKKHADGHVKITMLIPEFSSAQHTNIAHDTLHAFKTLIRVCFHTFQNSWR